MLNIFKVSIKGTGKTSQNFVKFTVNYLLWSSFFSKAAIILKCITSSNNFAKKSALASFSEKLYNFNELLVRVLLHFSAGTTINNLWKLFKKRKPIVDCAIDQWTKPFIWNELAQSEFIDFFYEDFEGERREEIYHRKVRVTIIIWFPLSILFSTE